MAAYSEQAASQSDGYRLTVLPLGHKSIMSVDFRAYLIELSEKQIEVLALLCYASG